MFSKYFILIFSACLLSAVALSAQRLVYDVQYEYYFDNREFDRGGNPYTKSMTISSSRLTPVVGFSIESDTQTNHKLILGAQFIRRMGKNPTAAQYAFSEDEANKGISTKRTLQEFVYYYNFRSKLSKNSTMEGVFGAFPRAKIEGEYSPATLSDSLKFYDPTIEGMLLKYKTKSFFAELGLDWMGMAGFDRKERFEIFSYGKFDFSNTLSAGWTLNFYHLAGSIASPGVVDNILLSPHLKLDFSKTSSLQRLSFKFSALTAYQKDRRYDKNPHIFMNGEFITDIRKCNLGIYNTIILGRDLMPYYNSKYKASKGRMDIWKKYATLLYRGENYYRHQVIYDRLELYWQPHLGKYIDLRLSFDFHFADRIGYVGSQQRLSLIFTLNEILKKQ